MGLLDKVKETAQKGADLAKEGVKAGQDKIDEQKLKKKISGPQGGARRRRLRPARRHTAEGSTPRSRSHASSPRSTRPRRSWPRVQASATPTAPSADGGEAAAAG